MTHHQTASDARPLLGAPLQHKGKAVVSSIDILGFSRRTLDHWSDQGPNHPIAVLRRIRQTSTKKAIRIIPDFSFIYTTRHHVLGDTIVISSALPDNMAAQHVLAAFLAVAAASATVCRVAAMEGLGTRGGVEIGDIYWNQSEVMGPAFIHAYHLESQIAEIARVIVGRQVLEIFRKYNWPTSSGGLLGGFFEECPTDGLLALSPALTFGFETKTDLQAVHDRCEDDRHREKYLWALDRVRSMDDYRDPTPADIEQITKYWDERCLPGAFVA